MHVTESRNTHCPSTTPPHASGNPFIQAASTKPHTTYQAKQPMENMKWTLSSKVLDPQTFNYFALW